MKIVKDERTKEQKEQLKYIVYAHDKFMSGWGQARDGRSLCAWAVETEAQKDKMLDWVEGRSDMCRVDWDLASEFDRKLNRKSFAHCSIYSTTKEHPVLKGAK
jgi:hypothetical protein